MGGGSGETYRDDALQVPIEPIHILENLLHALCSQQPPCEFSSSEVFFSSLVLASANEKGPANNAMRRPSYREIPG